MTTQVCWSPTLTIVSIAAVQHDFFAVASRLALAGARSMRIGGRRDDGAASGVQSLQHPDMQENVTQTRFPNCVISADELN